LRPRLFPPLTGVEYTQVSSRLDCAIHPLRGLGTSPTLSPSFSRLLTPGLPSDNPASLLPGLGSDGEITVPALRQTVPVKPKQSAEYFGSSWHYYCDTFVTWSQIACPLLLSRYRKPASASSKLLLAHALFSIFTSEVDTKLVRSQRFRVAREVSSAEAQPPVQRPAHEATTIQLPRRARIVCVLGTDTPTPRGTSPIRISVSTTLEILWILVSPRDRNLTSSPPLDIAAVVHARLW